MRRYERRPLRTGQSIFKLVRPLLDVGDSALQFQSAIAAQRFLRRFRAAPSSMTMLRAALVEEAGDLKVHRLDDEEVVALLSHLFDSGRICVVATASPWLSARDRDDDDVQTAVIAQTRHAENRWIAEAEVSEP